MLSHLIRKNKAQDVKRFFIGPSKGKLCYTPFVSARLCTFLIEGQKCTKSSSVQI